MHRRVRCAENLDHSGMGVARVEARIRECSARVTWGECPTGTTRVELSETGG